jgi:hypothetical protein
VGGVAFLAQHRLGGDQVVALSDRVVAGVFGTVQLGQGLLGDGASLLGFLRAPGGLAGRPDRLVASAASMAARAAR